METQNHRPKTDGFYIYLNGVVRYGGWFAWKINMEGLIMSVRSNKQVVVIDQEWAALIKEAKEIGMTMDEIKDFLQEKNK